VQIDLSGVQAVVTDLYRRPISRHLIFRFPKGKGGATFIEGLAPRITMADVDVDAAPDPLVNIGISFSGLSALGVDPALLKEFDSVFRSGPDAFALGDAPNSRSSMANWWENQFLSSRDMLERRSHQPGSG
jgi:hypothetical protein